MFLPLAPKQVSDFAEALLVVSVVNPLAGHPCFHKLDHDVEECDGHPAATLVVFGVYQSRDEPVVLRAFNVLRSSVAAV